MNKHHYSKKNRVALTGIPANAKATYIRSAKCTSNDSKRHRKAMAKSKQRYNRIDHWVYEHSTKPIQYVEVLSPPETDTEKFLNPQSARQIQFNNWSKRKHFYTGSYLPHDAAKLLKQGWIDTHPNSKIHPRSLMRKSTGQRVRHDFYYGKNGQILGSHWHWLRHERKRQHSNPPSDDLDYFDKYGNPCKNTGSEYSPHHIGEEGKPFVPVYDIDDDNSDNEAKN